MYNFLFVFILTTIIGCEKEVLPFENDVFRLKLKGKVKSIEFGYGNISKTKDSISLTSKTSEFLPRVKTEFNIHGKEIQKIFYKDDGGLERKHITVYNDNNKRILLSFYDSIGELTSEIVEKYDVNGNRVEKLGFGGNGKLYSKETIKYNQRDS